MEPLATTWFKYNKKGMNMKKLLIIAALIGFNINAQEVPSYMKGGEITVKLKDGKEYKYSSDEYMVVKRKAAPSAGVPVNKQPSIVLVKSEPSRNRLTVHGGFGYDGQNIKVNPNDVEVSERASPVLGLSYTRLLDSTFSLTGSVFTNSTITLGVGMDY